MGDGADGHSLWPSFTNVPNEFLESYFPLRIEQYETIPDSGGPGFNRGGNGVRVGYRFLEKGEISIHDDRWLTYPWGVNGGKPGQRSRKVLIRSSGEEELVPSKCDRVSVEIDDLLLFETWGGGGWGNPFEREIERVVLDVKKGLVTQRGAKEFGVVIDEDGSVNEVATEELREQMSNAVENQKIFDKGGDLESIKGRCLAETGFSPPIDPKSH